MKRLLITLGILFCLIAVLAIASFAAKTTTHKVNAKVKTVNSESRESSATRRNEMTDAQMDRAMMPLNMLSASVRDLGGQITIKGDQVNIELNLTSEQVMMLAKALKGDKKFVEAYTGESKPGWDADKDYYTGRANYENQFLHHGEEREGIMMTTGMPNMSDSDAYAQMCAAIADGEGIAIVPMAMEMDGTCPKCGADMKYDVKCDMMMMKPKMSKNASRMTMKEKEWTDNAHGNY